MGKEGWWSEIFVPGREPFEARRSEKGLTVHRGVSHPAVNAYRRQK